MGRGGKALQADISASAGYFLRMGIIGAIFASVPPSNAVIFTGWALSAGITSGFAVLTASLQVSIPADPKNPDPSIPIPREEPTIEPL